MLKDRSETVEEAAAIAMMFYTEPRPSHKELAQTLTYDVRLALGELVQGLSAIGDWSAESIMRAIQTVIDKHKLKLPKIAMPLRLIVFGRAQTPNIGPVLALAGKERVLERLREHLGA